MKLGKIRRPTKKEKQAYEAITGSKKCYGVYHKCCFHLHTPTSYDYRLLKDWKDENYQAATPQVILDECIKRRVVFDTISLDDIKLEGALCCYSDQKELLSYFLLADSLLSADIEIILVADHNTIDGVEKLKTAINEIKRVKDYRIYPFVMLGIEISCGDRSHVVGMFDNTPENRYQIEHWLTDHLIDRKEGVYLTSIEALEFINEMGGIGYIAHLNSSDILKGGNFSGGFKRRLFNSPMLRFVGLSDADKQTPVANGLRQFRTSPINFLLDNDAHNIEEVEHNCFWIKGGKCTYSMVAEALNDYHISVDFTLPNFPKQYIKGLYIERSEKGFLTGKGNDNFCVSFSNALNCFIGGRGTGKSSALEILEYALNQRCNDERKLNFICMHGTAWVVYELEGEDYLFEIYMPRKEYDDSNILENFGGVRRVNGYYGYAYDPNTVSHHAAVRYLHIHKIVNTDKDGWKVQEIVSPESVRDRFLDSQYSINELVNTAGGEEITTFIENTIFKNKSITDPSKVIKFRKQSGLLKMLNNFEWSLQQRASEIKDILRPFNEKMQNELRVVYHQDRNAALPDFEMLIYGGSVPENALHKRMNIKKSSVVQYASKLCEKLGPIRFFEMVLTKDIVTAQKMVKLKNFLVEMTVRRVESGIESITPEKEAGLIDEIFETIIKDRNMGILQDYFRAYLVRIEKFELHFNVNNREGSNGQARFTNVRDLSLGQKVVAMLTFILGYSEYSEDYRPLIIDQPEDNLDNQYIYKNLVKQLRDIKEKRQVIIATHNATIVTNAKADLVCEMQSDYIHGWIESMGYPSEERVKKKIINHLEGGIESFVHKMVIYRNVMQ